jgi:hypothetical protein
MLRVALPHCMALAMVMIASYLPAMRRTFIERTRTMLLHFSARLGSITVPWHLFATLRDNIQHHVEHTTPSTAFAMLHAIERAVDQGSVEVDAQQLHQELLQAWYALAKCDSREIAVGGRTLAILLQLRERPILRRTVPVFELGRAVAAAPGGYLCNFFRGTFARLFSVTTNTKPGDRIKIMRVSNSAGVTPQSHSTVQQHPGSQVA